MSVTQLDPPLWFDTPHGQGLAHLMIDYGPEFDIIWVCFITKTLELGCPRNQKYNNRSRRKYMPRGGSRKGEHRGNAKAKPEGGSTPSALIRAAAVRKPGTPRPNPSSITATETEIAVAQVIYGVRSAEDMTPKDVMVDNMHRFQNAAYEYEAMARITARQPDSKQTREAVRHYEMEEERNRRIASDEAYKVAPYMHNRRAAIAILDATGKGDDIVQIMLDEIDRKNREHPKVIEHEPQKKSA